MVNIYKKNRNSTLMRVAVEPKLTSDAGGLLLWYFREMLTKIILYISNIFTHIYQHPVP